MTASHHVDRPSNALAFETNQKTKNKKCSMHPKHGYTFTWQDTRSKQVENMTIQNNISD